jgi:hypothetical protein
MRWFCRWEHGEGTRTTLGLARYPRGPSAQAAGEPEEAGVREDQLRVERGSANNRPQQQEWAPAAAAPPAGGG